MTEFHIIGLGNLCEFVIKNIDEKQTYGTFSACDKHDRKSMQEFVDYVNQLIKEKEQLKSRINDYDVALKTLQDLTEMKLKENEQLKEENKELKEKNEFAGLLANHRGELVSFANALIQDLDDEVSQEMWEKFKDEMYKEWKQKRGIE